MSTRGTYRNPLSNFLKNFFAALVDIAVKPELGGPAIHTLTTLEPGSCNALGECIALATVELDSGVYFVEGTATYQIP